MVVSKLLIGDLMAMMTGRAEAGNSQRWAWFEQATALGFHGRSRPGERLQSQQRRGQ